MGREWLFERVDAWLKTGPGVCLLVGEPGVGKSAFLRALGGRHEGTVRVDVRRPLATDGSSGFWGALLSQLDLEGKKIPANASEAARWAAELLPLPEDRPRLVLIDSFEAAGRLWDGHGLAGLQDLDGVRVLVACRPGPHVASLQRSGAVVAVLDSRHPENLADLEAYLRNHCDGLTEEQIQWAAREGQGNFLVAREVVRSVGFEESSAGLAQGNSGSLDRVLWGLWEEVVGQVEPDRVHDMSRLACVLCEAGEPLDADTIADFLDLSAVRVRQLLARLGPLLRQQDDRYSLFTPRMSLTVARHLQRDLVGVHGDVVTFFRETFPSWEEMNDRYGWTYLAHHCDRFARTSRRRDFSVLHWLGEGPFIQAKLRHTGSLASVHQDLVLCLRAALEECDLPRIVSYGLTIPRLRADDAVRTAHLQADVGDFRAARANAALIRGEGSRFMTYLLLASQALEEDNGEALHAFLDDALGVPVPLVRDVDMPLYLRIVGDLLLRPDTRPKAFRLLDLEEDPHRAALACLGLARSDRLSQEMRLEVTELGISLASQLEEAAVKETRLTEFSRVLEDLGREQQARKIASSRALKQQIDPNLLVRAEQPEQKFQEVLQICARKRWEPVRVTGYVGLCEALRRIGAGEWVAAAFAQLLEVAGGIKIPRERWRALVAITDGVGRLGSRAEAAEKLDAVAALAEAFEEKPLTARLLAEVGAALYRIREFQASSRRFSQAAELAFGLAQRVDRADTLAFVAGQVARTGNSLRARDLAFNALEIRELSSPVPVDQNCRATLKMAVFSTLSQEKTMELFRMEADLVNQAHEYDLQLKAATLATLAGGVFRLGESASSLKLLNQAVGAARAMDAGAPKTVTLSRLASQQAGAGDVPKAEQLLKEALEALGSESDPGARADGYVAVATSYEAMGLRTTAREFLDQALESLDRVPVTTLASSRALLSAATVAEHQKLGERVRELVRKAESSLDEVVPRHQDEHRLALLEVQAALGDLDAARGYLARFHTTSIRSRALAELARQVIRDHPDEALGYIRSIPLLTTRMEAVRRCTVEACMELRPSRQLAVRRALMELTLLSTEDQSTADMIVSRWIFLDPRPSVLNQAAIKMGWLVEDDDQADPGGFRELELTSVT